MLQTCLMLPRARESLSLLSVRQKDMVKQKQGVSIVAEISNVEAVSIIPRVWNIGIERETVFSQ